MRLRILALGFSLWLASGAALAAPPAAVDQPPTWASLSAAQRQALAPLQRDWASVDAVRKEKWLEVASRFATMPRSEQSRVQARMSEWLRLSPTERARARLQFQEVKQLPPDERQERWRAYQALSPEERSRLAIEARPAPKTLPQSVTELPGRPGIGSSSRSVPRQLKSSPATTGTTPPGVPVSPPLAVQARPGATTNPTSTRPSPPLHNQAGLPKIAAVPDFVDPSTMLPKRGPQGAAVRKAPAADRAASAAEL